MKHQILVVDDHPIMRKGYTFLILQGGVYPSDQRGLKILLRYPPQPEQGPG